MGGLKGLVAVFEVGVVVVHGRQQGIEKPYYLGVEAVAVYSSNGLDDPEPSAR